MSTPQYLHNKYSFADDAQVPTSFLQEELHLEPIEIKALVKSVLHRQTFPLMISFEAFVSICSAYLDC